MHDYAQAFEAAWSRLIDWASSGKFAPRNEEDIQCFLYHGLVLELGTAIGIRAKATTGKPKLLRFNNGKLEVGTMHFPDLLLGAGRDGSDVVVEIKYRPAGRQSFYARCKADILKLRRHHDERRHYFVLFDHDPSCVFLDEHQHNELKSLCSTNCRILHYPEALSTSHRKASARLAVETMRRAGVDFVARGRVSAKKAVMGNKD